MRESRRPLRALGPMVSAIALAACVTVGPNFKAPPPPSPKAAYVAPVERLPTNIEIGALASDDQWWTLFGSQALDRTVEQALAGSPTLEAARARLISAREAVAVVAGGRYPQVGVGAGVSHQKESVVPFGLPPSAVALPPNFNLYQVGVNASYSLDLFGGTRRSIEAQQALADSRKYELEAASTTLTGNTASRAIEIAGLRAQLDAVKRILDADRQTLDLVRKEHDTGETPERDVVAAAAQLAADETLAPPLQQSLSVARHSLAALLGISPGELTAPDFDLADLSMTGKLPLSVPSELVRRRPDIQVAEARLHHDSAEIGVATARLYPQITLSAGFTSSSLNGSALFGPGGAVWSLAGSLAQPVFDGGSRRAGRREAVADFQASAADYRNTVLLAFAQVGDSLTAIDQDTTLLAAQKRAFDLASESLRLERINYSTGVSGVLDVLNAQRQFARASLGYAQVQGSLYLDTIQLMVAMGGGRWSAERAVAQNERGGDLAR
ncbi:MAG TPA: efflux transporter outer membrane subunit [Caulobacteraceae bacterium]|jgi:NodT family efflux transporter outer membrane factor (OMF) lipoprotein